MEAQKPEEPKIEPIPVLSRFPGDGELKPPFFVVDATFTAVTEEGDIHIGMRMKTSVIRSIPDGADLLDQLFHLLAHQPNGERAIAQLNELDIIDSRIIANKFLQAVREREEARLGESASSSPS